MSGLIIGAFPRLTGIGASGSNPHPEARHHARPAPRRTETVTARRTRPPAQGAFLDLRETWFRALRAANRSDETLQSYEKVTDDLYAFLDREGHPTDPEHITREAMERYFDWLRTRDDAEYRPAAPATVSLRFRTLSAFFRWATADDEEHIPHLKRNPMRKMRCPKTPVVPPQTLTEEQLDALLATCRGRSFEDRRDRAVILMFRWTGMRLGELTSMLYTDDTMDLNARTALVSGKTGPRMTKWSHEAATALDVYLRMRERHRYAHLEDLWIGRDGALSKHGLDQIIRRRAEQAGIACRSHLFRHTLASNWLEDRPGDEAHLVAIMGWAKNSAPIMLQRYGAADMQRRAFTALDDFAEGRTTKRFRK